MPIFELGLLILLFVLGVVAFVIIALLIGSAISGTLLLKRKGKKEDGEDQPDKEELPATSSRR